VDFDGSHASVKEKLNFPKTKVYTTARSDVDGEQLRRCKTGCPSLLPNFVWFNADAHETCITMLFLQNAKLVEWLKQNEWKGFFLTVFRIDIVLNSTFIPDRGWNVSFFIRIKSNQAISSPRFSQKWIISTLYIFSETSWQSFHIIYHESKQ